MNDQDQATFDVVNDLMNIIEANMPEFYSFSDAIARAEDLLVQLETEITEDEHGVCDDMACSECRGVTQ